MCDLDTNETFISRDVIFCETQFPFAPADQQITSDRSPFWEPNMVLDNDFGPTETSAEMVHHEGVEATEGTMDATLGPIEGQAQHPLLQTGEHEERGSLSCDPATCEVRGNPVA